MASAFVVDPDFPVLHAECVHISSGRRLRTEAMVQL
jgi:hypothetical protein